MAIRLSRTFVLRKLHQLSGIMPLGIFLLEHFYTNSKALSGAADFNNAVTELQSIPYILFVEIFGIFIPLIYHAVYGLVITMEARPNNLNYPYPRNWFYLIQRITGVILFFFITFHVLNFRFGMSPGLNTVSVAHRPDLAFDIVAREFRMVWVFIVYMIGITATVWHLANGIWLFLVDWGIAIGERAQRLTGYACMALDFSIASRDQCRSGFYTTGGTAGRNLVMGEVRTPTLITNAVDEDLSRQGQLDAEKIRKYEADAMVDTGAVRSILPPHVVERLGLTIRGKRVVEYAAGRNDVVDVTGPVLFKILGRDTLEEALVLGDEVLIGQTVLEKLDLMVD